ncbi:CDP-alcohol phosphatidyltransferase family protein [Bdellovibrio svalbardensis]|uniref:CDP-alcohol phosphatidyltransferase family protein n=1 Tax=Bdellovibrio svalbardensis TaxID=2972972 RepID=A0ABT6DEZ9_9BACT|nr:CDP-alcohol phosphatidyltransferase family protein [Bdellovibrio svalbardensis]MDG0815412.1 CDP-alcohol phosphatidyltransferase family protein [Bdellovibrio svalbardensis]
MESSSAKVLEGRRELKTRNKAWAHKLAQLLASSNISPNQISALSIFCALGGLAAFAAAHTTGHHLFLVLAVLGIQTRLLCNLMDGMVAIEFKKKSPVGDLYNEVPDRIADAFLILGAGLYCQSHDLAMTLTWVNIFLATMTAYIRALGASLGNGHKYLGPMAKQHRMALLTAAAVIELVFNIEAIYVALWIMLVGLIVTVVRRLANLSQRLKQVSEEK